MKYLWENPKIVANLLIHSKYKKKKTSKKIKKINIKKNKIKINISKINNNIKFKR